jgi:proton-translocating NADH-quinone oxidoreductase chain M
MKYSNYVIIGISILLYNLILFLLIVTKDLNYAIPLNVFNFINLITVDGISIFFVYLTVLLILLCMFYSYNRFVDNLNRFKFLLGLFSVELLLILTFTVFDVLFFYILFEIILIPFFLYIGYCSFRNRRIHASLLFFFFTLFGSLFMLFGLFVLIIHSGSSNLFLLWSSDYPIYVEHIVWFSIFIAFAVKVPIFPFHIWLPEAHVEAPTEGSVLLAGVLLKLGTYGYLRILFPLFPSITLYYSPFIYVLSGLALVYTSLTTLRQIDIKRIIAYSSVAHMNMCILGLFSFNIVSIIGSILLMIGHGLVSGGLFFAIGMLYERFHTKIIKYYSGIVQIMPIFSTFLFLYVLGNISMPGTSNFIGEFLILCGLFNTHSYFFLLFSGFSIFVCTVYTMWLYNKITFGLPSIYINKKMHDLDFIEFFILFIIFINVLWLGIYPNFFINVISYNISLFDLLN